MAMWRHGGVAALRCNAYHALHIVADVVISVGGIINGDGMYLPTGVVSEKKTHYLSSAAASL